MHAVVVDVTLNDADKAHEELKGRVVPNVSQAPGFVCGYWMDAGEGKGHSVVVFESGEVAAQMAAGVRQNAPSAVTIDNVSVQEVIAHA